MRGIRFFVVYFLEVLTIAKLDHQLNEEIRDAQVRLIDSDGSQLGIQSARDAQKIAYDKGLDLVKIVPTAKPPVCKLMDYGKFRYEQARKEKIINNAVAYFLPLKSFGISNKTKKPMPPIVIK